VGSKASPPPLLPRPTHREMSGQLLRGQAEALVRHNPTNPARFPGIQGTPVTRAHVHTPSQPARQSRQVEASLPEHVQAQLGCVDIASRCFCLDLVDRRLWQMEYHWPAA
jgi:hypothetical protein